MSNAFNDLLTNLQSLKEAHKKNIRAYQSALGILDGRDVGICNELKVKLNSEMNGLSEVETAISNSGSEYDFIKNALKRNEKA